MKKKKIIRKNKRRKLRKWVKTSIRLFIFIIVISIVGIIYYKKEYKNVKVTEIYLNDKTLTVEIHSRINDNVYCLLTESDEIPTLDSSDWVMMDDNKCILNFENDHYNLFVKSDNKIIYSNKNGKVLDFEFGVNNKYYPTSSENELKYTYKYIGSNPELNWKSSNAEVATINNGKLNTIGDGNATISVEYDGKIKKLDIVSTSLIVSRPKTFDLKKKFLPCEKYTEEENKLLDEILDYKAHQVGFKTRAAVVEVARFLTFDFPYRINYFNENGRLTQANKIDGEGRYYHVGLYLNSSKYTSISKSTRKPKIWGCSLYSNPVHQYLDNGLDCSGFVSWVLLNAGFDVGDLGAGVSNVKNLSQSLGEFKDSSSTLAKKLKVGDLLFSYRAGGHIAVLVGIDEKYYYVAQALWYDERGVIVTKATASELTKEFPKFVLMDKFYKEDGDLTNMWY